MFDKSTGLHAGLIELTYGDFALLHLISGEMAERSKALA